MKRYYQRNKELIKARSKQWHKANPVKSRRIKRKYRELNKEKARTWRIPYLRARLKKDISFKLYKYLGNRMRYALRASIKLNRTPHLLGCSISDFKIYLESKFTPEMTWENYGPVWEIDHIMPCAIFDLSKPEHQRRCFHFSNLQPLLKSDNRRKSKKVTTGQFPLI